MDDSFFSFSLFFLYLFTDNLFNFFLGNTNTSSITHNSNNNYFIRVLIIITRKFFVFFTGKVDTSVGVGFNLLEIGTLGTNDETTSVSRNSNLYSTLKQCVKINYTHPSIISKIYTLITRPATNSLLALATSLGAP